MQVDLDAVDIFMVDRHSVQLLENQNGPSSGEPVDDADYNVKKGVLLRVPSTVPNRPEKVLPKFVECCHIWVIIIRWIFQLKIEVRRGTTAVDDRYKRKTSPSDAVIDQTQESRLVLATVLYYALVNLIRHRPLLINVRLAWTPSVHNGCSVQTYEVRRRLSLYISR